MSKSRLGRGLDSLLQDVSSTEGEVAPAKDVQQIPLSKISGNPEQPRKHFDPNALAELVDSVREKGIIQPILLVKDGFDEYKIVAGERRFRAATEAGLATIPALVRDYSPQEVLEIALIENIQRSDLSALEEARAYKQLMELHQLSQDAVAKQLGKGRPTIANAIRLLKLPLTIQEELEKGKITQGHARALLALEDREEAMIAAFQQITRENLSVRATEKLIKDIKNQRSAQPGPKPSAATVAKDPYLWDLEEQLITSLSTKVEMSGSLKKGKVVLHYYSQDDLQRLLDRLMDQGSTPQQS